MDLTLTDEQSAIRELAARILEERLPAERLRELEATDTWHADDVWRDLGAAGLLGAAVPEADGGLGFGLLEACLVAEEIGRRVAPLPYLSVAIGAALPIAAFGSAQQRNEHLPGLLDGSRLVTVALHEAGDVRVPGVPVTTARHAPDGTWRLDGEKQVVVAADRAAAVLVPARTSETTSAVFLVDPHGTGVELERQRAVTGEPQWTVRLLDTAVDGGALLGGPEQGAEIVGWTVDRLMAAACAMQTGVCEEALAITARYVSEREQFGARLGTFQAVGQRVADAYIDTEGIRLTALQAIWRLDAGVDASEELLTAKFWAGEGAQRVVHAAQHLHGGIGMDLDYPIHRYFRTAKVLELLFGGSTPSLLQLGAHLAARPPGER